MNKCLYCGAELPNGRKYCSNECLGKLKHLLNYLKILDGDESIMRANFNLRDYKDDILLEQDNKCAICGMSPEWNNKQLIFIIDHIDGHASNNYRLNLRMICPNCDSLLDTYKSKNKNGDRSYYRYHK